MPSNNEYKRYFIILQEDDKGYELAAGKIPTGYAKIEVKNGRGKLTAYAQNIKNGDKADYRMLLVAPSRKAAIDMGRLMVDATGRGELNVEFDADNVMKSGMNISDLMVAAVSSNTGIPLSGYTGRDKIQWKGAYNIINKSYERADNMTQPIQQVVTPVQTAPIPAEMPEEAPFQMPTMPKVNFGTIVEGAKNIIGNVVEGAKDVVSDVVGDVVEGAKDIVEDVVEEAADVVGGVVQGAKNVVGGIKNVSKKDMLEEVTEKITPVPIQPAPAPVAGVKKTKKDMIEEVTGVVTPTPIQPQVIPVPVQPVEIPIVVKPIVEQPPVVQPIISAPKKPIYETETEIKAKFVIETETEQVHHEHKHVVECPEIDYKDFYCEDESECDSDSDSECDSDDREKHHEHHKKDCDEHDHDKHSDYEDAMQRRLMKVLGRLRKYEPFEDEESREDWFKIEDDIYLLNNATIPFMGSMMPLGYPYMMNECIMMIGRKDYIIGVKYDKDRDKKHAKHIMFGMPGMNNKQEEEYYRMRGFVRFKPHKSRNYGYWIMTVDMRTGQIITK